ncbi:hypothetical protein KC221_20915, partial [Mycobacterium tuberculosis]|nr:hypothetical protein [Mycobacterium tuberculosis]
GPVPVGPVAHPPRRGFADNGAGAARAARFLHGAGSDRRRPLLGPPLRRHRLGAHRRSLRRPRGARALARFHLVPSVRGELLARLGRDAEAVAEFTRAAELATNEREREVLRGKARRLGGADAAVVDAQG